MVLFAVSENLPHQCLRMERDSLTVAREPAILQLRSVRSPAEARDLLSYQII